MQEETKDELILALLHEGVITVNAEYGRIYSTRRYRGVPLKGYTATTGYIYHGINYNGKTFHMLAHRVVWMSVHGLIPDGLEIDHINRVKNDNHIANLRVVTSSENKLNRDPDKCNGEANPSAKLTEEKVREIRRLCAQGTPQRRVAALYGVNQARISDIIRGKAWKHCLPDAI